MQTSLKSIPGMRSRGYRKPLVRTLTTGIERYDIELDKKRVTITGKSASPREAELTAAPPSQLLAALKSTERQVLVRGASSADPSVPAQAAVSILESPIYTPFSGLPKRELPGMNEAEHSQQVFGIARFVQIAPRSILMDLTVRLPPKDRVPFNVYVSETGNLVNPPETTGDPHVPLGSITPDKDGYGDLFKEVDGELWEWIGRACVVEPENKLKNKSIFAGVVARSAGAWGNEKTVCACSGQTMWEEGRDMERKGLL